MSIFNSEKWEFCIWKRECSYSPDLCSRYKSCPPYLRCSSLPLHIGEFIPQSLFRTRHRVCSWPSGPSAPCLPMESSHREHKICVTFVEDSGCLHSNTGCLGSCLLNLGRLIIALMNHTNRQNIMSVLVLPSTSTADSSFPPPVLSYCVSLLGSPPWLEEAQVHCVCGPCGSRFEPCLESPAVLI